MATMMMPDLEEIVRVCCRRRGIASEPAQNAVLQQVRYRIGRGAHSIFDAISETVRAYEGLENGLTMWPERPRP